MAVYTKEEFKRLWELDDNGGGLTFDDVADCAQAWGVVNRPRTKQISFVMEATLKAAGCLDEEDELKEDKPKQNKSEMKEIELPTERRKAENYNPKLLILFGFPKSGKSSAIASLNENLVIDLEDGYRALDVMLVKAKNIKDIFAIKMAIEKKIKETGKQPYRFITIDNATRLEEMCIVYANSLYRATPGGKNWGYLKDKDGNIIRKDNKPVVDPKADVRLLPNGGGYLYLRKALKEVIHMFMPLCETLILVCHVKDKQIQMNGMESSKLVVDLAGKLSDIICGEADAVGYVYREANKTYISFDGGAGDIREARPRHLRGKSFVVGESDEQNNLKMDMSKIFDLES